MEARMYPIGQAAKLCNVSQRTLRYYEERGLIKPDMITDSRYRYYNAQTMRVVQVIQYFIAEGFSIDEVEQILNVEDFERLQKLLEEHMDKTKDEIRFYHQRLDSMAGWYNLITEGKRVLEHGNESVSARYVPSMTCVYIESDMDFDDPCCDTNLEIEYYAQSKNNGHTMVDVGGAFLFHFKSFRDRIDRRPSKVTLMQEIYPHASSDYGTMKIEGFTAIDTYHIGSLATIERSYERAFEWARSHNFKLNGDCYEQHIIDIYSTPDEEHFVTRIILPTTEKCDDFRYLEELDNA